MMQTQWPGLGPSFDLSSLDAAAGDGRRLWPGDGAFAALPSQAADSVARPWWSCGSANANAGALGGLLGVGGGSGGSLFGIVSGLVNALQQLANMLLSQSTAPNTGQPQSPLRGGPQRFQDVDVSSTGDPHIAETGTRAGGVAVDSRWDSMTSHDDLVHSNQIEGGYRVSTAVTAPDPNGVTSNDSRRAWRHHRDDAARHRRRGRRDDARARARARRRRDRARCAEAAGRAASARHAERARRASSSPHAGQARDPAGGGAALMRVREVPQTDAEAFDAV